MDLKRLLTLMSVCGLSVSAYASSYAAGAASGQQYDPKTLAHVQALYGLSEDAAVSRLAREYEAAVQARRIEERHLASYAGAWFDSATQALHVAVSSKADFGAVERVGATPVLVGHSMLELESTRNEISNALMTEVGRGNVKESHVDVQANAVVIGISANAMNHAGAYISTHVPMSIPVRLTVAKDMIFSTNLLGADATQNATSYANDPNHLVHPCSVGASAEKVSGTTYVAGFATAGHCGFKNDIFQVPNGTTLGAVKQSTYVKSLNGGSFTNNQDGAWVATDTGWLPQPQVNGYSDGTLNVSGTWAGMLDAPTGTTVCRYGSASGGPHCASVSARDVTIIAVGGHTFNHMIQVNGVCTNDGDSGGTLISPSNQVQGTDTGSEPFSSCPDNSTDTTYYQPITTTVTTAGTSLLAKIAVLTSHGRSAPTMPAFLCPDPANSGEHIYECTIPSFDSQGLTNILWTANTYSVPPAPNNTTNISGTCSTGQIVTVALAVTNPYGTTNRNYSFTCPINPLP